MINPVAGNQAEEAKPEERVTAVTVDFFRKGSYAPALAATAPLWDSPSPPRSAEPLDTLKVAAGENVGQLTIGGNDSDTEATVGMLWLQVRASKSSCMDQGTPCCGGRSPLRICPRW